MGFISVRRKREKIVCLGKCLHGRLRVCGVFGFFFFLRGGKVRKSNSICSLRVTTNPQKANWWRNSSILKQKHRAPLVYYFLSGIEEVKTILAGSRRTLFCSLLRESPPEELERSFKAFVPKLSDGAGFVGGDRSHCFLFFLPPPAPPPLKTADNLFPNKPTSASNY